MSEEEKAIERCNELIKPEHSNWIGISNQVAIETVLNLIDKQNKVIDETSRTIIKERGYKNIDEHPEWIENTKRFFFKKVENDERREKFFRKVEGDDNSTSK